MILTMNRENPKDSLSIFDNFQADTNLPKFKKEGTTEGPVRFAASDGSMRDRTLSDSLSGLTVSGSNFLISSASTASTIQVYNGGSIVTQFIPNQMNGVPQFVNEGIFARAYRAITKFLKNRKEAIKQEYEKKMVQYVFESILTSPEKLALFDEKNSAYEKLIANAKSLGQTALVEQLEADREVRKFENACIACDINMALTEAQLLKFADKCEKGLKLDWIKNFARVIPQEAIDKKKKADENGLFDNYCILYFDPDNKCTKKTQKEIDEETAKRKDPILFGVMRGNRRLYFIHDWKDDLCDLTMKQVADVLGNKENLSLEQQIN